MELTRQQIEQMPAGTELDNLIHERVMRLKLSRYVGQDWKYTEACYSIDMADAWQVVEQMQADGWGHSHRVHSAAAQSPGCQWTFMQSGQGPASVCTAEADTPALAICRAALLVFSPTLPAHEAPTRNQ